MSEEAPEVSNEDAVADIVGGSQEQEVVTDRPENVPEKFWDSESKSVRTDAVLKSYGELESKFGSFTGAPDDYEMNVSDEMQSKFEELGMSIDTDDDPLYEAALNMAKDTGMNQEGFNKLTDLYLMSQLADIEANKSQVDQEMKSLGDRAESRINNLQAWGENNLDAEMFDAFSASITTAEGVKVFEHLIAQTRNAPVSDIAAKQAPSISASDVESMQFAKDEHGNRRISTDPAFRAEYQRKLNQLHGDAENRVIVG